MASRDRSQGFGFVYFDLAKLLAKKEPWDSTSSVSQDKTIHFNKDSLFPLEKAEAIEAPAPAPAATATATRTPVEQIRENLDRLQSLHHRIHVMLEELNQLGKKKKS